MGTQFERTLEILEKLSDTKSVLLENMRMAKSLLDSGKISDSIFNILLTIDKTPTKKYMGWMSNIMATERPNLDNLDSYINKYDDLLKKNKIEYKDIYQIKTFRELQDIVDSTLQNKSSLSKKDLTSDYEVAVDNEDLTIIIPYTHEAARKFGLRNFNFRDMGENGEKDCAWCITYKSSENWDGYFYNQQITFYLIRIKSEKLNEVLTRALPGFHTQGFALGIYPNGEKFLFDGLDKEISEPFLKQFLSIISKYS